MSSGSALDAQRPITIVSTELPEPHVSSDQSTVYVCVCVCVCACMSTAVYVSLSSEEDAVSL